MLAIQSNPTSSPPPSTNANGTHNNNTLSHILIDTISKTFGNSNNTNNSSSSDTSPSESSFSSPGLISTGISPLLPTYKSNLLNLSCIIEEEPPPCMMMSHIQSDSSHSNMEDPNANLKNLMSDPNLNLSQKSEKVITDGGFTLTSTVVSTTTKKRCMIDDFPQMEPMNHPTESSVVGNPSVGFLNNNKRLIKPISSNPNQIESESHTYCHSEDPSPPSPRHPSTLQLSIPNGDKGNDRNDKVKKKNENLLSHDEMSERVNDGGDIISIPIDRNELKFTTPTTSPIISKNEMVSNSPLSNEDSSPIPNIPSTQKHPGKSINGNKHLCLKRVSFGSSKGSMVETLIFESPQDERRDFGKTDASGTDGNSKFINNTLGSQQQPTLGTDAIDSPSSIEF